MPLGSYDKGDLYVQFDIQYPKSKFFPKDTIQKQLEANQPKEETIPPNAKEIILEDTDVKINEPEEDSGFESKYARKKRR